MADTDDNSWTPFRDKSIERAARIPIVDVVLRLREAEWLTLNRVYKGKPDGLEIRWRDADGHKHTGLPSEFWQLGYDRDADCLRELFPNGRALYQPEVREYQRNPDKPADSAVDPEHADLDADAHKTFPPDGNPSAVATASPPASASPPPPSRPAPSEPASSSYGELEADKAADGAAIAAGEGLTPEVLAPNALDQVSGEHDDAAASTRIKTNTSTLTKTDRVISLLPDLDKQVKFKSWMKGADIEKIVEPLYKKKFGATDVPSRSQIWRAYEKYREKHPLS